MSIDEVTFSDLLNRPKETLGKLESAPHGVLRVHRRTEEDLVLTTQSRAEQISETLSVTIKLFVTLLQHSEQARASALEIAPQVFPWMRFLPADDAPKFLEELLGVLEGSESLDNFAPVAQVVIEWRNTAEIMADPEIMRILSQDGEDFGPVPRP
ncbi:hypothetical protein FHX82_002253 [Amycolatopsis bartoniae]|uniref:Prevent-host-death family protein n=1 Tax=Amycolatopsis bartoniae TaxID=941986 RepID=A0A8H9IXS1_9PSEU|nr:hypothetical protein [Amycolatopsis bartoniae]MBB2935233.1 hypothetical protein [Amycolatopsis bartoniae]TVT04059.1 hypothetical protein FNH07_24550 [Amycolatopsis bartoniae]GHF75278.1 hypothetical protein GCM10017566_56520 [Amycolatopsis bartoniae]